MNATTGPIVLDPPTTTNRSWSARHPKLSEWLTAIPLPVLCGVPGLYLLHVVGLTQGFTAFQQLVLLIMAGAVTLFGVIGGAILSWQFLILQNLKNKK